MCNEKASDLFYEELGVSTLDKAVARYRNREGQMMYGMHPESWMRMQLPGIWRRRQNRPHPMEKRRLPACLQDCIWYAREEETAIM